MTWNPLTRRDPVTFPIGLAGVDEHGEPRATATFRPWAAEQRIAYEDALTTRLMELGIGDDEDSRGDVIRLGSLRLVQLALTIESVTGFPDTCEITTGDGERAVVPFDPRDERCLRALDGDTYEELRELAAKVQTPPGDETAASDEHSDADAGAGEPADGDPSPTPPTPPVKRARPRPAPGQSDGE